MPTRKRVSLTVEVNLANEEDRANALHNVTESIKSSLRERSDIVSFRIIGGADYVPLDQREEWKP